MADRWSGEVQREPEFFSDRLGIPKCQESAVCGDDDNSEGKRVPHSPRLGVCPTAQQGPILPLERLRPRAVARYRRRTDELAKEPLGGVGQVPSEGSDEGIVGVATAARNRSALQEAQPGASVRQPGLEPCAVAAPRRARGRSRACPRARRGEVEGGEVEAARSGALLHRRRRGPLCGWRERAIIVPEGASVGRDLGPSRSIRLGHSQPLSGATLSATLGHSPPSRLLLPEGEREARRCRRPPAASAAAAFAPRSDQVEEALPPVRAISGARAASPSS